jgi:hypothetical protein
MLQPLKTKYVVGLAIVRDGDLPITWDICLLIPGRDVNTAFVNDER